MSSLRALADRFHQRWLAVHPLAATSYGIPGYDHLVPDDSPQGHAAWRAEVEGYLSEMAAIDPGTLTIEDRVTLGCLHEAALQEVAGVDSADLEYTVTSMPFGQPGAFFAVAARSVLVDADSAESYVTRLERSGLWLDQLGERLRDGAAKGRLPVAPLVEQAIQWAEEMLAAPAPGPLLAPQPPPDWAESDRWEERRQQAGREVVKPALGRWTDVLRQLLPEARGDDRPGLAHIPGGEADYARAVRLHTTLDISPEELHRIGLEEIAQLEERARQIGAGIGLSSLEDVLDAIRDSAGLRPPQESIEAAVTAIRRSEARASEIFPEPLPPPCEVTAMPSVVAISGAAPHYTPPRLDGGRPGTFWFNTERPTAGTGWDLEAVAFHEAVPGHHLQLSRLQMLTELPALQRQRSITVFSEGWGLYAEQLAGEVGLYADERSVLGAISASAMRAARLVVDTGLHAMGWSRRQALEFFTAHVPMPPEFLAAEIERYIVMPGQALSYYTGKLELLRLRDQARKRLGPAFALPSFHAAVLDRGSLPLPVLRESLEDWAAGAASGFTA
jgi:uncharacterized protein (DUF885 family)